MEDKTNVILNMAEMYIAGDGVEQDVEKGIDLYKQLAKCNNLQAMLALASIYGDHNYRPRINKDYKEAARWYLRAIQNGADMYEPFHNLGLYYEFGFGVVQDYNKALYYHKKAVNFESQITEWSSLIYITEKSKYRIPYIIFRQYKDIECARRYIADNFTIAEKRILLKSLVNEIKNLDPRLHYPSYIHSYSYDGVATKEEAEALLVSDVINHTENCIAALKDRVLSATDRYLDDINQICIALSLLSESNYYEKFDEDLKTEMDSCFKSEIRVPDYQTIITAFQSNLIDRMDEGALKNSFVYYVDKDLLKDKPFFINDMMFLVGRKFYDVRQSIENELLNAVKEIRKTLPRNFKSKV